MPPPSQAFRAPASGLRPQSVEYYEAGVGQSPRGTEHHGVAERERCRAEREMARTQVHVAATAGCMSAGRPRA